MFSNENRYLFKFAWLSIRRNAGRSFFIGFSVSLAVIIAVWVVSFFDGMNAQIEEAVVATNTGFFQLQDPLYAYSTDSSAPRELSPALLEKLRTPAIKAFSPELVLDGNISTPEGAAGLSVIGIIPEYHRSFITIARNLVSGDFLGAADEDKVLIGKDLAEAFRFSVGDQLVLNYQDQVGGLRSENLTVGGIYTYGSPGFEKRFVYINQGTWKKLFLTAPTEAPLYNRIPLMTESLAQRPAVLAAIRGEDLKVKTWKDLNPEMAVILEFHDGMIKFFLLIIALTITMTILTPVRMLWQERYKELKMMSVLGVSRAKFWKVGMFEVFLMILLSASLSSLLLILIIGTQSYTGVDVRFLNNGIAIERAGIKLPGIIFPVLTAHQLILTFGFVVFVLGVSYVWSVHSTIKKVEGAL